MHGGDRRRQRRGGQHREQLVQPLGGHEQRLGRSATVRRVARRCWASDVDERRQVDLAAARKPCTHSASCSSSADVDLGPCIGRAPARSPRHRGGRCRVRSAGPSAPSWPRSWCAAPRPRRRRGRHTAAHSGSHATAATATRGRARRSRSSPDSMRSQQPHEAIGVHGLVQAVVQRLRHQRMVGDLALAGEVLGARLLVGKHHGEQVFGIGALELRRHLAARRSCAAPRATRWRSSASACRTSARRAAPAPAASRALALFR